MILWFRTKYCLIFCLTSASSNIFNFKHDLFYNFTLNYLFGLCATKPGIGIPKPNTNNGECKSGLTRIHATSARCNYYSSSLPRFLCESNISNLKKTVVCIGSQCCEQAARAKTVTPSGNTREPFLQFHVLSVPLHHQISFAENIFHVFFNSSTTTFIFDRGRGVLNLFQYSFQFP